jgi:hypothetical protein
MRRLTALALVVALTLALTAPTAEARHGHVVVGIGAAVGLALIAPFIIVGSILSPLVYQPPVYAYPPPVVAPAYASPPPAYAAPAYAPPPPAYAAPAYAPPPPAYASRTVALQPPPASHSTTVQYPHGRYELRGDGVRTAYQWVWIPNAPPPPPPPAAPPLSR